MKYLFWILAAAVCFAACKDPKPEPPALPEGFWGTASAQKDGKLWTASPFCRIDLIDGETLTIQLDSFWHGDYLVEALDFYKIPPAAGIYKVIQWNAAKDGKVGAHLTYWDDDVALGIYDVLGTATSNQLVVESYDTASGELKGTFDLVFLVSHRPYPNAPDTIRFREGKFHGRIHKK